jgi:hypothetical protein
MTRKNETMKALEQLRANYLRRVQKLAEQLCPRFEVGELHGYREEDEPKKPRLFTKDFNQMPAGKLGAICRRTMVRSQTEAYLVLACSPSERRLDDEPSEPMFAAENCVMRDVLRTRAAAGGT